MTNSVKLEVWLPAKIMQVCVHGPAYLRECVCCSVEVSKVMSLSTSAPTNTVDALSNPVDCSAQHNECQISLVGVDPHPQ